MPGGFASLDTSFPNLEGQTTEQKLRAMEDYLVQLLENLRYTLHNLGVENLNVSSVKELGDIITEPIRAEIDDPDTGLSARINANADAITMEVSRATGAESLIRQSADDIKAQVTDGQGNYTVLNLKSDGLHIGNASGTSTIDGGNITANSITLTQLGSDVTGSFGDDNPAYIKSTYIDFRQVSSPAVYAGDFYGGEYHDADGDSTLDIESFSGFTALMYGPNTMQSLADATLGVHEFGNNHVGHFYIGGAKILTAGGSQSQATQTQNLWDFSSKGMAVMYGTDAPATYFSNHGLTPATGQVYFKI